MTVALRFLRFAPWPRSTDQSKPTRDEANAADRRDHAEFRDSGQDKNVERTGEQNDARGPEAERPEALVPRIAYA